MNKMNNTTTAKLLPAATVAGLTMLGLTAAPAGAAAHSATPATGAPQAVGAPSAGKTHPGLLIIPADKVNKEKLSPQLRKAIAKAASQAKAEKARGFVPRTAGGGKVTTATGCNGHVCIGVYGNGLYVSHMDEHFWGWGGCHRGAISWGFSSVNTGLSCYRSKQDVNYPGPFHFLQSAYVCANFNGVSGIACEKVHR
jgi:hypothetical protein